MRTQHCLPQLLLGIVFLTFSWAVHAQTRTVGKIYYDDSLATLGYTLFTPNQSFKTYLIENCGLKVHEWYSAYQPGMMAYLREDGLLLRTGRDFSNGNFPSTGGNGGYLELLDWWSQRLWLYKVSDTKYLAHHDVWPMPNGNILVLAWERFNKDSSKIAGRNPNFLLEDEILSEAIFELKPIYPDSAIIAWEWHLWDHLVQDYDSSRDNFGNVQDHPELMDINYLGISQGNADWLHANSVAYNPDRDEIVLSFRETSEVIVIDHSTTISQAASHSGGNHGKGGDILFRWGNPEAYRRGIAADRRLWEQHDAHWVEDSFAVGGGQLIIFNNGLTRPGGYSSVEFVQPETDSLGRYVIGSGAFQPNDAARTFTTLPGDTINSSIMGGAHMLPNGNMLVSQAVHGRFVEFDTNGTRVWDYISPALPLSIFIAQGQPVPGNATSWNNAVFKARKYIPEYPGLEGQPLPHGDPLENFPYADTCSTPVGVKEVAGDVFEVYPNPARDVVHVRSGKPLKAEWELTDGMGRLVRRGMMRGMEVAIGVGDLPEGIYVLRVGKANARKIVVGH